MSRLSWKWRPADKWLAISISEADGGVHADLPVNGKNE